LVERLIRNSYLLSYAIQPKVGYDFLLSAYSASRALLESDFKSNLRPYELPQISLARFAVDRRFAGRGLEHALISEALRIRGPPGTWPCAADDRWSLNPRFLSLQSHLRTFGFRDCLHARILRFLPVLECNRILTPECLRPDPHGMGWMQLPGIALPPAKLMGFQPRRALWPSPEGAGQTGARPVQVTGR
jgi:hypothetical protein